MSYKIKRAILSGAISGIVYIVISLFYGAGLFSILGFAALLAAGTAIVVFILSLLLKHH